MNKLIYLIRTLRGYEYMQLFTIYLRYLVGGAFVMASVGMGKLSSHASPVGSVASQPLQELTPIQLFFRVMSDSGLYWNLVGWTQMLAGVLLVTQRFASLGAAVFFALILNIFAITVSYGFSGTPIITGLMLLAGIFLLLWDIEIWQFMFRPYNQKNLVPAQELPVTGLNYWTLLGVLQVGSILLLYAIGMDVRTELVLCFLIGLLGYFGYLLVYRRRSIVKQ